jgi:hypothetical protein
LDHFQRRKDRADDTVKTVLVALNQTKAYITDWNKGERSREREHALVRLWTEAAVAIRRHDKDFADALQMKAEYWADPENWTDEQVRNAGIGIETVANKARLLLGNKL